MASTARSQSIPRPTSATTQPDLTQLRRIIGDLTDGVVFAEPDGRITWANAAALAMHGVASQAELGATIEEYERLFDLRYRDRRPVPKHDYPLARLCRGHPFSDVVVEVSRANRPEPDWVHRARGLVLHEDDGAPGCLVLVITDATDAFEAERRFESIFNANPAPALIVRLADLRYARVNEGFLELSGYAENDMVGRSLYDLDILAGAEHRDRAKALLAAGKPIPQMEAELPGPDGRTRLVLMAGHPAELANEACMIFTFADLEPRRRAEQSLRQSEERFATSFRLAPVPMMLSSLDGHRILNVNHAFLDITGWSHEAVIGRRPAEIELWDSTATRRELERRIVESGSFRGYELKLKTRQDRLVTCLVSAETVTISDQHCILSAFQDISDRKRTELDLVAAIEGAMQDSTWLSGKIMDRLAALRNGASPADAAVRSPELTRREREVLALITRGKGDSAIADALSLKRNTVRNHVARLYAKIGAHNRSEAIIWARERGHQIRIDH